MHHLRQYISEKDINQIIQLLQNPDFIQGSVVELFEAAICDYIGSKFAITFDSATSALFAAYSIADISKGDEIITTPMSFVATSNMFVHLGAKPIWCDIKLDGNIDERFIERLITPQTKAIVPVDFAGKPVAIQKINDIAKKHKLLVIQDSSLAFGSSIDGKKIGTFADMTIFSFDTSKPLTIGKSGCVVTDNEEFAKQLRLFRSHGVVKKQFWNSDMVRLGHNFLLTDFAAALGKNQLTELDHFLDLREKIALYYDERFANNKLFSTVKIEPNTTSSRDFYPIILNPALQCPKEDIFKELQERGIDTRVHYKPIYQHSFYIKKFGETRLHVTDDFYRSEISIPCHQEMSMKDATFVADTFLEIIEKYSYRGCSF
jgi:UDP-4-amino-4,6-dideoxy-L-N-acetyl-beta-L-altrosamine transaminase